MCLHLKCESEPTLRLLRLASILILFTAIMSGCASLTGWIGEEAQPGQSFYATASWYGRDFHGRQTASGEHFNMNDHTAAHRTLPFGTVVRITNLRNGKHTTVRINDRGPWVRGRDIDLSYGAARDLGMLNTGLERVFIEVISAE
jgi:rare lipoprotein A